MGTLEPFERLRVARRGRAIPLPRPLARVYGPLSLPSGRGRPWTIANLAETVDGVTTLDAAGRVRAGEITGKGAADHLVMGLLRALADVVVVGAGTLRSAPRHRWSSARIYPPLADEYALLRARLGRSAEPETVIVSASGRVDLRLPVFDGPGAPARIVTGPAGARRLESEARARHVRVTTVRGRGALTAPAILSAIARPETPRSVLVEGGPHLLGTFLRDRALDELFVTVAPQLAGRIDAERRPGLVAGVELAPDHAVWGSLVDVRASDDLLFLRYALDR
jgi:riboflavin biosynthesis pyrimidine reductase